MSWSSPSHPGFFHVVTLPRAYTTLLYLLLSLATGILGFTFVVTGLSLSLGLAILVIGLPVALAFLLGVRLLALGETHLLRALVAEDPSPAPAIVPAGSGWLVRLTSLLKDRRTWTSLLYFLLHLPLGILAFSVLVSLLAVGLGLLAVPVAAVLQAGGAMDVDLGGLAWSVSHPQLTAIACGLLGAVILPLSLHLGLLLGRLQVWLARHLLVRA